MKEKILYFKPILNVIAIALVLFFFKSGKDSSLRHEVVDL